ncbi:Gfo/Idh/MocA family oxidoreductase [Allorhodopirellula solitaria]|uniref:Glucose--fructose oxidoreductase n=1 Tax=Allorhodopirellula solitaria TaxID=2527987 RepID=A0A5C5X2S8_9BACT|nr:Glucose--fructose oxidoreductase precursor [Allorhodopirellula solitaria]
MAESQTSSRRSFLTRSCTIATTGSVVAGATAAASRAAEAGGASGGSVTTPVQDRSSTSSDVALAPPDKQPPNLSLPEVVDRKVGFAIVGLGVLSLEEILPAFAETQHSKCVALVSGHPKKAAQVAKYYGVKQNAIYDNDNYDRLSENSEVEAVYIVLPNNMHAEYTIRGSQAGGSSRNLVARIFRHQIEFAAVKQNPESVVGEGTKASCG